MYEYIRCKICCLSWLISFPSVVVSWQIFKSDLDHCWTFTAGSKSAHSVLEQRKVKWGCGQPNEVISVGGWPIRKQIHNVLYYAIKIYIAIGMPFKGYFVEEDLLRLTWLSTPPIIAFCILLYPLHLCNRGSLFSRIGHYANIQLIQ